MRSTEDRLFSRWCRRGDARALAALFDRVAPRLLRLGVHLVGDAAEAEDLVQVVFVALIEQRERLDPDRPAGPWLTAVLGHKAKDVMRRAARQLDHRRLPERIEEAPSAPAEQRELSGELARALDRLEEPYRQPAVLRLRHGLSMADIAHVLGRDPGTVRVQLHRALEKLRTLVPASLATALAVHLIPARGLAAVRACVLGEAGASEVAATSISLAGAWIVKQKITVALGALLALVAFALWPGSSRGGPDAGPAPERVVLDGPAPVLEASSEDLDAPTAPANRLAAATTPSPAARLSGRVIEAGSGRPIAGATVRLFAPRQVRLLEAAREYPELYQVLPNGRVQSRLRADWPHLAEPSAPARFGREPVLAYDRVRGQSAPRAEASTDRDGRFTLDSDAAGGLLVCEHPGHGRRVRAAHDPAREWLLALWEEREVTGLVLTPSGDPPGVPLTIGFVATREVREDPEPRRTVPVPAPAPADAAEGVGAWKTESAADGSFTLRMAAETVRPSILTPGWKVRNQIIAPVADPMRIVVEPVPMLRFFDADTQAPIERVHLLGRDQTDGYIRWSGMFDAPGGLLELPGTAWYLQSWNQRAVAFTAWAEGYAEAQLSFPDLLEEDLHDVPLQRGQIAELWGTVSRAGHVARGAVAALLGHSPLQWREDEDYLVDAVVVDEVGRFRLRAARGRYLLRVDHDQTRYFELIVLPRDGALDLDLDATGQLEVGLADEAGTPRARHVVALHGADGRSFIEHTDADGQVLFADLPPQDYTVMAPFVTTEGSFSADVFERFVLARGERRAIHLELPVLGAPAHLRVQARDVASFEGWRARFGGDPWKALAPDGTVRQELPSIHHVMEVQAADGRRWTLRIPRGARDGDTVDLDLGDGSYVGMLLDAEERPLVGWGVHAVPLERAGDDVIIASTHTDARGRFELVGLYSGVSRLDCRRQGYDFSNGHFVFTPDSPAGSAPALTLRVPTALEQITLRGVVLSAADRRPLADHIVLCDGEVPSHGGAFVVRSAQHPNLVHTDARGVFELLVPHAPRCRIRVYAEWSRDGLVLDETFDTDASAALELLVD